MATTALVHPDYLKTLATLSRLKEGPYEK